jgi:hypothetical protein
MRTVWSVEAPQDQTLDVFPEQNLYQVTTNFEERYGIPIAIPAQAFAFEYLIKSNKTPRTAGTTYSFYFRLRTFTGFHKK